MFILTVIFFIILGPGFYNILNSIINDNSSNICLKKQNKSAFGSSVPRTLFSVQKETFITPGPADYQVIYEYQIIFLMWVFKNLHVIYMSHHYKPCYFYCNYLYSKLWYKNKKYFGPQLCLQFLF